MRKRAAELEAELERNASRGAPGAESERRHNPFRARFQDACRVLESCAPSSRADAHPAFASAVRAFAVDARRAGVPIERMIVLLKATLVEPENPISRAGFQRWRESAVSMALEAYYRPD